MASNHGNKKYYQLLIDPARAELLERMAAKNGLRATQFMREMIYTSLKQIVREDYEEAAQKDKAQWQRSVQNRVDGRAKAAATRTPEADPTDLDKLITSIFK